MVLPEDVITKFIESIYRIENCQKPSENRNFKITVNYVVSTEITVYMSWVSLPKGLPSAKSLWIRRNTQAQENMYQPFLWRVSLATCEIIFVSQ
jgi:hypothetical protein